jgi:hypothetical protein
MNGLLVACLLLLLSAALAAPTPILETTEKSCRDHSQLAGKCFAAHGRLSVYNGAPAVRPWRTGTRRVLGVSEQRFNLPGYRNLPETLAQQLNGDNEIVGDFVVCPFTRPKPREMQLICIESVKNVSVRSRSRYPERGHLVRTERQARTGSSPTVRGASDPGEDAPPIASGYVSAGRRRWKALFALRAQCGQGCPRSTQVNNLRYHPIC